MTGPSRSGRRTVGVDIGCGAPPTARGAERSRPGPSGPGSGAAAEPVEVAMPVATHSAIATGFLDTSGRGLLPALPARAPASALAVSACSVPRAQARRQSAAPLPGVRPGPRA
ncbi:hypothetical protein [Streptomyces sp. NPDC002587]